MKEFYLDERPPEKNYSGGWQPPPNPHIPTFPYHDIGDYGNFIDKHPDAPKGDASFIEEITSKWHLIINGSYINYDTLLLTDGDAYLLRCDESLISGVNGCVSIQIYCQIENDPGGSHVRCILLSSTLGELKGNNILNQFTQGEMKLFARWQSGHYDINKHRMARFKINNFITPWINLNLHGSYTHFATLTLRNGVVTVKSIGT